MNSFEDATLAGLLEFPWSKTEPERDKYVVFSLLSELLKQDARMDYFITNDGISGKDPSSSSEYTLADAKTITKLKAEIASGLRTLRDGSRWKVPKVELSFMTVDGGKRLKELFTGEPFAVLVNAAAALIKRRWEDIRFCADPQCGRAFLRSGRREYHDPACSQRVRHTRWKSNLQEAQKQVPVQRKKRGRAMAKKRRQSDAKKA